MACTYPFDARAPTLTFKKNTSQELFEALIERDSQGPAALERGLGQSPKAVNQCFLNIQTARINEKCGLPAAFSPAIPMLCY
jgi:hypothetical protein